jgi:ABC-2 type transport system ATP-binding protein
MSKRYGRLAALEGVSFTIREGEVLGLIGPNGAGKTTLFECMSGLLPSTAGVVLQGDRVLDAMDRKELLFYLPDSVAPWPAQTVGWALDFAIGFFGGRPDERPEVARSLGLEPLMGAYIGALSKGQRKRVLLAIGLLTPHPFLLVDEPFEGLDVRQSREVAATLRAHAAKGRTLFLSIHQISEAARICDRFVLLSSGRVCAEGTLAELRARAAPRVPATSAGSAPAPMDLEEVFLALT